MASSCCFPDIWAWIHNLPPTPQWRGKSLSISLCPSGSTQPSLNFSIINNLQSPYISFAIFADFKLPVSLWSSKPFELSTRTSDVVDEGIISSLFRNFITDILNYGLCKSTSFLRIPPINTIGNFKDIFNLSFLTLTLFICIYEAPHELRPGCLNTLKNQLTSPQSREASKLLMRLLGSNIEEQWMRALNLAITNWVIELQESNNPLVISSPLFSYAISTAGLWKVQLYCPVIAMKVENSSNASGDERLNFSLKYHQLEGVIQFAYKVVVQDKWVDVMVNTDNIRCDVIRLVSETLMAERGVGASEKHFPSRISLQLTPTFQASVLSVSVGKSSQNPTHEIGMERTIEGTFDPPNHFGLNVATAESMTRTLKPWQFEQSVIGDTANLNWYLHDSTDGREVFSSRPSKVSLAQPKAWFKNRYSNAHRPFTKEGGVIFAGDQYGESVWWKMNRGAIGKTMEWEIRGKIWLTYWPNKHRTSYNDTRRLEFREILNLHI
ncbi:uncharacterized protein LOC122085057 [Macadamia integrifolia]|uniref:uncharacterized protein LOC122085057 n=1 Tax=Macadamia integrifolia TaxID=60698 RepID=UPI001C4FAFD3|nr:uncharacterized protein LOC122085057 [Macadamia integrifolia]